jgi:hypothetical protein
MKQPNGNGYDGQNWAWPQKTWFRERLNALKAREQEARRKPAGSLRNAPPVDANANDEKVTKES